MKTRWFWLMMAMILSLGTGLTLWAQDEPKNKTKEVMKFKLHYAQRVLEGIATENFEVIAENAKQLKGLSQQADWQIRQTVEYQKLTADFAHHAESLEKAAVKKNVDAATVAYFQLTVSCTTCHRYLRGEKAVGAITFPKADSA
ncbi:MAG: hypothetical protein ABIP71_00605, partial [Verrucomicrobiota bacterium]